VTKIQQQVVHDQQALSWSITQGAFSLGRSGQRILFRRDCFSARVLYSVRLNRIELDVFREFRWKICFRIDRVHRTYVHACHAIDAFIRMNDQLGVHFIEARNWAHLYTVGEFASVTFVRHNMGHGIRWLG
jgi:hypothetical protein